MKSRNGKQLLRRMASVAFGGLCVWGMAQPAHAFSYNTGDVLGVFVEAGTEMITNLGPSSSLSTLNLTFTAPSAFGVDGVVGSKLILMQTQAPFAGVGGPGQNFMFSTDGTDPRTFDSDFNYALGIPAAQASFDDGTTGGWAKNLHTFPAAGIGGVITNNSNLLVIPASNGASYSSILALGGDNLNNSFPFSVADQILGTQSVQAWCGVVNGDVVTATTTMCGMLNLSVSGANVTTTFTPVPEPVTAAMLTLGLVGLGVSGRRRQSNA